MNCYIVLGSAIVGLLVGLTGAGGGALMTPMLILVFNVKPAAAISSDLVAAVVMRPVGAAVHFSRQTVNVRLVGMLTAGSVPSAFLGVWLMHRLSNSAAGVADMEKALGAALLLGAAGMALRAVLDRRGGTGRRAEVAPADLALRPIPTVVVGIIGGLVVGMTSVGAGSLMVVALLFLYPGLAAKRLVGTDLAQAIPLTGAAALGALIFGHVSFPLTGSVVVGAVPAVFLGSLLSSRVSDRFLRPAILLVILASGLKYVGMATDPLAVAVAAAVAVGLLWHFTTRTAGADTKPLPATGDGRLQLQRQPA